MDDAEKLQELYEFMTSGVLSESEFEIEKKKLLEGGPSASPMPSYPQTIVGSPTSFPPQRGTDPGVIIIVIVIVVVIIVILSAALLYVWAASFLEQGESAPIATFFVQEGSDGVYHVDVIKVSRQEDLAGFSFYLKDETGSTYVGPGHGFGEISMQIINGEEYGIDQSYNGDDEGLQNRAANVSDDDGSEYPVHFRDYDQDGKLSAGDKFMVYGSGNAANGPASDNWSLDIQFDASGDIIGSAKML